MPMLPEQGRGILSELTLFEGMSWLGANRTLTATAHGETGEASVKGCGAGTHDGAVETTVGSGPGAAVLARWAAHDWGSEDQNGEKAVNVKCSLLSERPILLSLLS